MVSSTLAQEAEGLLFFPHQAMSTMIREAEECWSTLWHLVMRDGIS
jgi:hypothetical protein